jgi:hypothetical protein
MHPDPALSNLPPDSLDSTPAITPPAPEIAPHDLCNTERDAIIAPWRDPFNTDNGQQRSDQIANIALKIFHTTHGWVNTARQRTYKSIPKIYHGRPEQLLRVQPTTKISTVDADGLASEAEPNWWSLRKIGSLFTTTPEGVPVYTALPFDLISMLDVIDWTPSKVWPTDLQTISGDSSSSSALNMWREMTFCSNIRTQALYLDKVGPISALGTDPAMIDSFLNATDGKHSTIKTIRISDLTKGNLNTPVTSAIVPQTPKQIKLGSRLFLYRTEAIIMDMATYKPTKIQVINLGMFIEFDKLQRNSRIREYFRTLYVNLSVGITTASERLRFIDSETFLQIQKEKAAKLTEYSDIGLKVFGVPDASVIDKLTLEAPVGLTDEACPVMGLAVKASALPEKQEMRKATQQFDRVSKQKSKLEATTSSVIAQIDNNRKAVRKARTNIQQYEAHLVALNQQIIDLEDNIKEVTERNTADIEAYDQIKRDFATIQSNVTQAYDQYQNAVNNLIGTVKPDPWFEPFSEMGINIMEITYTDFDSGRVISVSNDSSVISNQNARITALTFATVKPSVITVDPEDQGDKAEKIVGGPYVISVTYSPSLGIKAYVKMATAHAVFGHHPTINAHSNEIFYHPHAEPVKFNNADGLTRMQNTWAPCCLGEVESTLFHCFKHNDARGLVFAMRQWLTCANSADKWGQNWVMFPPLSSVNLVAMGLATAAPAVVESKPDIFSADALGIEDVETDIKPNDFKLEWF